MAVGMAVSGLVDPPSEQLKFENSDSESPEFKALQGLINVADHLGTIEDLAVVGGDHQTAFHSVKAQPVNQKASPLSTTGSKIVSIQEVEDDAESEDDLPVYAKPDSDEEDEEDDPTLVQRNKPTAPVYIRDLLRGLRDGENYDRFRLALTSAPGLIRRKASFGTEVTDHVEELASLLVGLGDNFNVEGFQKMRQQAMIAVLVAAPLRMGKWYCTAFFTGDYSMSQRASVLTTLSIGARDLAGFGEEDAELTGTESTAKDPFPSKRLPDRQAKVFGSEIAPVNALAGRLEDSIIRPMALAVADKVSGPNILKVRTFSSRMEVEKRRKRPITNELAKIVADGFFFPPNRSLARSLTVSVRTAEIALEEAQTLTVACSGSNTVFTHPFLLSHFLKTLALILHASGTSTLSLPALTTEFWSLLLALRPHALEATPVLEALLFGLLTLLNVNGNDSRGLADDHAQELMETQAWVEQVVGNVGGGSEEGDRLRMLASGVLVRIGEVVEKYQRAMFGRTVDFG